MWLCEGAPVAAGSIWLAAALRAAARRCACSGAQRANSRAVCARRRAAPPATLAHVANAQRAPPSAGMALNPNMSLSLDERTVAALLHEDESTFNMLGSLLPNAALAAAGARPGEPGAPLLQAANAAAMHHLLALHSQQAGGAGLDVRREWANAMLVALRDQKLQQQVPGAPTASALQRGGAGAPSAFTVLAPGSHSAGAAGSNGGAPGSILQSPFASHPRGAGASGNGVSGGASGAAPSTSSGSAGRMPPPPPMPPPAPMPPTPAQVPAALPGAGRAAAPPPPPPPPARGAKRSSPTPAGPAAAAGVKRGRKPGPARPPPGAAGAGTGPASPPAGGSAAGGGMPGAGGATAAAAAAGSGGAGSGGDARACPSGESNDSHQETAEEPAAGGSAGGAPGGAGSAAGGGAPGPHPPLPPLHEDCKLSETEAEALRLKKVQDKNRRNQRKFRARQKVRALARTARARSQACPGAGERRAHVSSGAVSAAGGSAAVLSRGRPVWRRSAQEVCSQTNRGGW